MYIHEATKEAIYQHRGMRRESSADYFYVVPTIDYRKCYAARGASDPYIGWTPSADDLLADDWVVCDIIRMLPEDPLEALIARSNKEIFHWVITIAVSLMASIFANHLLSM